MARESKRVKAMKVNFGSVEGEPGRRKAPRIPEGDYLCKITGVEKRVGKESKKPYLNWKFQVIEDSRGKKKHAGVTFYYNTSLQPEALFNLRNLIHAASDGKKNVTGKAVNFDPNKLVGKKIGVVVEDGEYKDKIRSEAADIMPVSAMVADESEDSDASDDSEDEEASEDEDSEDDSEDEDESEEEDSEDESEDSDDSDDLEDVDV